MFDTNERLVCINTDSDAATSYVTGTELILYGKYNLIVCGSTMMVVEDCKGYRFIAESHLFITLSEYRKRKIQIILDDLDQDSAE